MAQPAQTTRRRSGGAVVLAIPLLAVLVLAGVGMAASLRAGARAERVRGLVPYTGALTTLVHELQRERRLSTQTAPAGPALETARVTVDGAAAAYRDAAVRVEISDRDRRLHQRIDTGLAQLAELPALRATVDDAAGSGVAATAPDDLFRGYTRIVYDLLTVGGEIGLLEAGQDAGLLRAVTAASAFSRAKELADRERSAATRATDGATLDPGERTRLAALGGRQDALLDQFAALASPEQLGWYRRAFPDADVVRSVSLRRAALDGGPGQGPDLAGWSETATARVERMREVELGVTGEVAALAGLADRAADRRVLAYAAALFVALSALVVLLVLAAGHARRSRGSEAGAGQAWTGEARAGNGRTRGRRGDQTRDPTPGPRPDPARDPATRDPRPPLPAPLAAHAGLPPSGEWGPAGQAGPPPPGGWGPYREGSPTAGSGEPAVHSLPAEARAAARPGLADLARRSQDLVDQQLELLDQVGRDQADPRLPGRLLQVDRLAVRARRNAHNLIVLAGGEPGHRWDGPVPLAEVAALAVRDNPDAPRVDLAAADDLLVPGLAAGDLASLLAELVDNATAYSAPETRVRVGGQKVGSGYVLEVEDGGLGMTDEELAAVNRRLAGDSTAGDDPGNGLGTWVAGRLAGRHQVKVQLRRSPYGGVTALVFLPERLVSARSAPPSPDDQETARDPAPGGPAGPRPDAALASLPMRRYVTQVPEGEQPLPRRAPHASLAPDLAAAGAAGDPADPPAARSPEAVRSMLTRYRSGLERGRAAAARDDLPDDPDGDLAP